MQFNRTFPSQLTQSPLWLFTGIVFFCIALKFLLLHLDAQDNLSIYFSAALVISMVLCFIPYHSQDKPLRIIISGSSIMLGLYALTNYPSYFLEPGSHGYFFEKLRHIIPLLAVLSLWRPSFSLPPILYTAWRKDIDIANIGYPLSQTDYMPVIEVSLLLTCGLLVITLLSRFNEDTSKHRRTLLQYLLMAAIGIHFGNYFHSGLAKLMLDGGPLSWALHNHTYYLIPATLELGTMPLSRFPELVQAIYDSFKQHYVLFNTITLIGQLACIIMITSVRRIIAITLFYDAMHIAIFLVSGIFFWKWIILNALIVAAMSCLKTQNVTRNAYFIGAIFTAIGILFFFTARLAWYDTQTLRHVFVKAVDQNDNYYLVPTNYFLNASVTVAQGRLANSYPGHFALTDAMGSTQSFKAMQLLNKCNPLLYRNGQHIDFGRFIKLIQQTHQFVSTMENEEKRFNYDLFPHHIWSNPFEYAAFLQLHKQQIEHYTINIQSKCLIIKDGRPLVATINHSSSEKIIPYE